MAVVAVIIQANIKTITQKLKRCGDAMHRTRISALPGNGAGRRHSSGYARPAAHCRRTGGTA